MNFGEIISEMANRIPQQQSSYIDPVDGIIGRWVNQGIRYTSMRHPWSFLRQQRAITFATNETTIDVPGEPIDPTGRLIVTTSTGTRRIPVIDRTTAERWLTGLNPGEPAFAVFQIEAPTTDPNAKTYQLRIYPQADVDYNLTLDGFFFLDPLTDESHDNRWTIDMPYLIMEWAMIRARQHRNEYQKTQVHEAAYEKMLMEQVRIDNQRQMEIISYLRPTLGGRDSRNSLTELDPYNRGSLSWW